ncbi:hypothetical protein AAGT95_16700 [Salinicola lusitanus]|uniref:Uncharacterized protein n=1 Tax=Salinicola lusitanus TaxID=1949085 RepID=A0ABZ3CQM3_9GAMM
MKLCLRRSKNGHSYALHDSNTGEILPAQQRVEVIQEPGDLTKVVVTFVADARASSRVQIERDDV